MDRKARLGLYLKDETLKRRIKMAAAKRGMSTTAYCAQAIEERLRREAESTDEAARSRAAFLARVDKLRKEIGPIKGSAAEIIKEGRRR